MDLGIVVSSLVIPQSGYINKLVLSKSGDKLFAGCERGIFLVDLDSSKRGMSLSREVYLRDKLVSQVFEFTSDHLIVSVFD